MTWKAVLAACFLLSTLVPAGASDFIDSPYFADPVAEGVLEPVDARLPSEPYLVDFEARGQTVGQHGGRLITLMKRAKDMRYIYVYGYARLVKYDSAFNLVPDLLKDFGVTDGGRTFTFTLREGHRWSDGAAFTTEDFRYFWEEMALNEDLFGSGPPAYLKVRGEYPTITILSPTQIRYAWSHPNPDFLPKLAQARPSQIYAPAHYLSQFHPNYVDVATLEAQAKEKGQRNWAAIHIKANRYYRMENPDLPTLQPWVQTTRAPADRFVFKRNPFYHKVDRDGRQLPYIDELVVNITEEKLISGKTATGDVDFQARYLRFDDVTLLKRNEKDHDYRTFLWRIGKGAHQAILPNLTHKDPNYRKLVRDVRFRRALSMAIDRKEINRVIYFGLALEGLNAMLPASPLYREEYRTRWARFDPDAANALLDDMGLERRWDGARLGYDGEPIEIIVETSGSTEQADILELVADRWWTLGIKIFTKPLSKDTLRRRIFSGQTQMTLGSGFDNGLATPDMSPTELAPTSQVQYQWSEWGEFFETNENGGTAPDMDIGLQLMALRGQWYDATSRAEREAVWHKMLEIHADQIPSIGLVAGVQQPVVVADGLMNLPKDGLWNWNPGSQFGLYGLDHVYWDTDDKTAMTDAVSSN